MDKLKEWWYKLVKFITIMVTCASALTAIIPNPSAGELAVLHYVHKILDYAALNVANNAPTK